MELYSVVSRHNIHRKFLPLLRSLVPGRRYIITYDSMIGSQLMGLGSVSAKIYNIHVYFHKLTVGQCKINNIIIFFVIDYRFLIYRKQTNFFLELT